MARYLLRYMNHTVMLAPGETVLGRSPDCGLPLDDTEVSRRHAVLHVTGDAIAVEDLGSRNGIFVNGSRVEGRSNLGHGDVLSIGKQEIRILEEDERQRRAAMSTVPSSEASDDLRAELAAVARARSGKDTSIDVLSPRELEVLKLLAYGHTNKEVASELDVSVKTVETYRGRIGEKLSFKSRADLVRYALVHGLLEA